MTGLINLIPGEIPLWGHPFHGLVKSGRLILPEGVSVYDHGASLHLEDGQQVFYWPEESRYYLPRVAHSGDWVVYQKFAGQQAPTRTPGEQAQDASRGQEWRGDFMISGGVLYNTSLRGSVSSAPDAAWIYRDGFGLRWLIRFFGLEVSEMVFYVNRFGELGAAPLAHDRVVVPVPAEARTVPAPTPPNTSFTPAPVFSTPIRLEDVHPEGGEAVFSIPINTQAIAPPWAHAGERTAGSFIKIVLTDGAASGTRPELALEIHASPADTLGTVVESTASSSVTPVGGVGNAGGTFVLYWLASGQRDLLRTITGKLVAVNYLQDGTLVETRGDFTREEHETVETTSFSGSSQPDGSILYDYSYQGHSTHTTTVTLTRDGVAPVQWASEWDHVYSGAQTVSYFDDSAFREHASASGTVTGTHDGVVLESVPSSAESSAVHSPDGDTEALPLGYPPIVYSGDPVVHPPAFEPFDQFLAVGQVFGVGYPISGATGDRLYFQAVLRPGNKVVAPVFSSADSNGNAPAYQYRKLLDPKALRALLVTADAKRLGWAYDPLTEGGTYADPVADLIYC